jgi:hypothetical protein
MTTRTSRALRTEAAHSRATAEIHWSLAEAIAEMMNLDFIDENSDLALDIYEQESARQMDLHAEFTADAEDRIAQAEALESQS